MNALPPTVLAPWNLQVLEYTTYTRLLQDGGQREGKWESLRMARNAYKQEYRISKAVSSHVSRLTSARRRSSRRVRDSPLSMAGKVGHTLPGPSPDIWGYSVIWATLDCSP